jgi:hypothetical protein
MLMAIVLCATHHSDTGCDRRSGTGERIRLARLALTSLERRQAQFVERRVSANWRITFEFENGDANILDLEDYH